LIDRRPVSQTGFPSFWVVELTDFLGWASRHIRISYIYAIVRWFVGLVALDSERACERRLSELICLGVPFPLRQIMKLPNQGSIHRCEACELNETLTRNVVQCDAGNVVPQFGLGTKSKACVRTDDGGCRIDPKTVQYGVCYKANDVATNTETIGDPAGWGSTLEPDNRQIANSASFVVRTNSLNT
jgi:hypothetical protein